MSYPVIPFEQPAGTFYLSVIPAADVIRMSQATPRIFDPETLTSRGGIQRQPSKPRLSLIAEYAASGDATFPTAILLAVSGEHCTVEDGQITITGDHVADIVDGQHRLLGIQLGNVADQFALPVVFMIDATEEEKALVFATINGTQTKVPASLVYELFGVSESRSPAKTAHEIARALNSMPSSPLFRRLKMLGRKSFPGTTESLSQGTFVKLLLPHITRDPFGDMQRIKNRQPPRVFPECIFNEYFREEKDSVILKILLNTFDSAKRVWPQEWNNPTDFVLSKTLGFSGIMKALPALMQSGKEQADLSTSYFDGVFQEVKRVMHAQDMSFTTDYFSPGARGEAKLRDLIRDAIAVV